jgi:dienelactone hydrolase
MRIMHQHVKLHTHTPAGGTQAPADSPPGPHGCRQGSEDKVVPVGQAEEMHRALKAKGLPTALVVYQGEAHGFRQSDNIRNFLEGELYFFGRVFGFSPSLDPTFRPFPIDNLPQ